MSESRLWNHVICQAISDSYLGGHHEKLAVARWVKSDDFEEVCDMAELNTDRLRGHMKQILTSKEVLPTSYNNTSYKYIYIYTSYN